MQNIKIRLTLVALLALMSACTETVYQPYPASPTSANQGPTAFTSGVLSDQTSVVSVPGNTTAVSAVNNTTSSDQFESLSATPANQDIDNSISVGSAGANTAAVNAAIAEAAGSSESTIYTPAVIGEPGDIVDCSYMLPCRWVGADEDFTLTVGNVGNTGKLDRLSITYTVSSSHDSELLLGNGSAALAPGGAAFNLVQQTLGDGNGLIAQTVLAGGSMTGTATYDRSAESNKLAGWTLTIIDNGLPRTVGFINLPIDTPDTLAVNCAGVLPCQWVSSTEDAMITLIAVGGYSANGRLNVNFNITTARDMNVVLGSGTSAISSLGEQIEGRTHGLGTETGFADIKVSISSNVILPGNVSFFRTAQPPSALNSLDLVIYEDAPIPRWNPQFINLPTQ